MKKKIIKNLFLLLLWSITIIFTSAWVYENPESVEILKNYYKKNNVVKANSFQLTIDKVTSLSKKTAFILYEKNFSKFNPSLIEIFTQDGYIIVNSKVQKLNLPDSFTLKQNGGLKTVFFNEKKIYGLIASQKNNCFYGSIVSLENNAEIIHDFKCLPDKKTDFGGLGSSSIHINGKILLTVGTVDKGITKNSELALNKNFYYGKIIEIDKNELNSSVKEKLNIDIFSLGHRNPQGITKINETIFSVEHGPKGGDELNKIIKGRVYGWPKVSFGTRYLEDNKGKSILISHENSGFEPPLVALIPSVAISSVNKCPLVLKNYYKKNCLIALSLHGNKLRPGKSIIIFLLNKKMDKVQSVEKIYFGKLDNLKFRHFATNSKNELYEDDKGSIYISADQKGIYKITFEDFR